MKFKTNVASAAVAAALGMMAGSAQAVYMSEDGTGQVLIYPYYTVQAGYDTYLSVVNSTDRAKAVKVRFIEGKASQEVLDFNLYLSKYDVWTAAVTTTTDGGNAMLRTADTSCTAPQITGDVPFRNTAYSGVDSFENDLKRTREGYVEIIEMGVPRNDITTGNFGNTNFTPAISFEKSVTHNRATGKPTDCAWVTAKWVESDIAGNVSKELAVTAPTGGLFGSATLINVAQGTDYSYDPTVLAAFSAAVDGLHQKPGSVSPSLSDADAISVVIKSTTSGQQSIERKWNNVDTPGIVKGAGFGINAVNAVLIRGAVMNEYALDAAIHAGTDWVVTFPTKRLNVGVDTANLPWTKPFGDIKNMVDNTIIGFTDETFKADGTFDESKWKACETVSLTIYGREEETNTTPIDFSPPTPSSKPNLCKEVNVITFKGSKVLGSVNLSKDITNVFTNGWISLGLWAPVISPAAPADHYLPTAPGLESYRGLPVTGFAVERYVNGNVGGVLSNYGGSFIHKYRRDFGVNN